MAFITGNTIEDRTGTAQPTFYGDDVSLGAGSQPPAATNSTVTPRVDAGAKGHSIITVTNFNGAPAAQAWQLSSANLIDGLRDLPYSNGKQFFRSQQSSP